MQSKRDDGGQAFPTSGHFKRDGEWHHALEHGMNLRQYYKAAAIQGLLASDPCAYSKWDNLITDAANIADAAISEDGRFQDDRNTDGGTDSERGDALG